jgi:radical SAM superfamily enzyme YgiQ (UPF0313 family)
MTWKKNEKNIDAMELQMNNINKNKEKILLVLLPFWTPQIPPLGITCLKGFLQAHGYLVCTVDANVEDQFKEIDDWYFDTLKKDVPEQHQGNFYNVAQDILRNHLMAHLNQKDEEAYRQLVRTLIYETFFITIDDRMILRLNELIAEFYHWLESYFTGLLEKENPGVLGISVFEGTLPASLFAFKLTREKYPHIQTVMGGGVFASHLAMGSPNFEFFLENTPFIDKIIVGEGEELFLKLLAGQLPGSQRVYSREDINNETMDLHQAVLPDFSDIDLRHYPYISSYTSRSCPFQCSFCSETLLWGKYRKKKPEQIAVELKQLYHQHNRQLFLMGDSLLNPVIMGLALQLVNQELSLYWDGYLRVDELSAEKENTLLWRKAGFYRARLGIESGSPHVLQMMAKRTSPAQIKQTLYSLANAGIKTTTYWVVGHPGETEEDFQQTLQIIKEMKTNIYEAWCSPFYFYLTGQVNASQWEKYRRRLYPEYARDMLLVETWVLDTDPTREEAYQRMNRFTQHCQQLGIPNPYSMFEFYKADERWKNLHKNAVPSMAEFLESGVYIDENKTIGELSTPHKPKKLKHDITFDF